MSVRINTNIEALNAQRNLSATASVFAKSVEKLSSGLRINRAADDSAGLAISEKLKSQVMGLNQAQRNAQDGVSMVQTAEGALTEVHSMLARIRELAVEAANSTLSSTDAASVSTEITSLRAEIDRIAKATSFNGQFLLTGTLSVSQSGGTMVSGKSLNTGHNAVISAVDVSGAKASTTYTITSQAGGKVTLSDTSGHSQQVTLSTIGATGGETVNFDSLGVKITVMGDVNKSASELATDLATGTVATATIGGVTGSDLVNNDTIAQTSTVARPVALWITGGAVDNTVTATASAGVAAGALNLHVDWLTGHVTTSALGGENFSGDLAGVFNPGNAESITLTGTRGNTIQLDYTQSLAAGSLMDEAIDIDNSTASFIAGTGTATVSALAVNPAAATGTFNFSSSGLNSLTLSGPGGPQTAVVNDMGANATQSLTFGAVSFTLTADASGMSAAAIISNLLQPANDTIVVTPVGGSGGTVVTGAGTDANFQIGANAADFLGVAFADATVTAGGYGNWNANISTFATATSTGNGIVAAAQALITSSDTAISYISTTRGNLGAVQNRLEHTTASISVASENLNASESRIRDLDVASEMVNFTKTQILQQAGTAILAQANSAPQGILSLLR